MKIVVIDTGTANLHSLGKAITYLGYSFEISSDPKAILKAKRIFLPGVGAFSPVMKVIAKKGIDDAIKQVVHNEFGTILGICLGMQLLAEKSDEGAFVPGLNLISGTSRKLNRVGKTKVPHVGFNSIKQTRGNLLLEGIAQDQDFYFVHSYALKPEETTSTVAYTENGEVFTSVIDNGKGVFGVQFHPEKSHLAGIKLIRNFIEA